MTSSKVTVAVVAMIGCAVAAGCANGDERALGRGDEFYAIGDFDRAIAEYKLAQRVLGDTEEVVLRLGHAYAANGDVFDAVELYEAVMELDPGAETRDQVTADLVELAREAAAERRSERMTTAIDALVRWKLGHAPADVLPQLANVRGDDPDPARRIPVYLALLEYLEEPGPDLLYRVASTYQQLEGSCRAGLTYYGQYLEEATWRDGSWEAANEGYGACLYQVAEAERTEGRPEMALELLTELVELGVPRTLMVWAHFRRGEIFLEQEEEDLALESFNQVMALNPTRSFGLTSETERYIRQLRFGL